MKTDPFSASDCKNLSEFLENASRLIREKMMARLPDEEPGAWLYDLMRDYPTRGGKQFRSALVLLACEWFGGKITQALPTAVAFELFQNFALIHDDIEDDSLTRRGKPTLHRLHGIPLALNTGDALLGLVYETLLTNPPILGESLTLRLLEHFNKVARHTFEGQAMDIGWVCHDIFPTKAEYEAMTLRKTGWYSGKGPCQAGALIAGANATQLAQIGKFGEAIGIGFQARDDVLNLITHSEHQAPAANAGGYGKERGGDIAEGKRTLIVLELFERLPPRKKKRLHQILLKPREENTEEEIEWTIAQAKTSGALEAAVVYCQEQAEIARQFLETLPPHPIGKFMEELIAYLLIERDF